MGTVFVYLAFLLSVCLCVRGQKTGKPEIYSLRIRTDIKFRFATTLISSRVANPQNSSTEAVFDVTLPDGAFISNFTMEIDGVVYPASIDDKEKALDKYTKAKKKGQSAGHVSKKPRDTNRFKMEISIAGLSKVTFNLTYQELLSRSLGMYTHKVYVNPRQPVDDLRIDVAIQESREITDLRVPPIRNDLITDIDITAENELAVITQPTPSSAFISYFPNVEEQLEESPNGIAGQFVVEYDIDRALDAGDVLAANGYFVHFFAPAIQKPIPKDVLFVLDTSGSMADRKITQLQNAMRNILDDITEGDRFNIMEFDGGTNMFKPGMVMASQDSIQEAKAFVKGLRANGWTNINQALLNSLNQLKQSSIDGERSPVVVFLTDGEATSGVQNNDQILRNVKNENEGGIPVFSLAFGQDADWELVKKVALQNNGIGKKIYEDSDADLQISGFYDQLAVTLLNNVSVKYLDATVNQDSLTKSDFNTYFQGSELVVAGRLDDTDANTVDLQIFGNAVEGNLVLTLPNTPDFSDVTGLTKDSDFEDIIEKTWAYLSIKQLLGKASIENNRTAQNIMKERAKELALRYSFVTPLTSLVVTKPEEDEPEPDGGWSTTTTTTTAAPSFNLNRRWYGGGRGYGGGGGGDPHYMIRERGITHPICFDLQCHQGEIYRLLKDPEHGIAINTMIIESPKLNVQGNPKTFIGEVAVLLQTHKIVVTPNHIFFDAHKYSWKIELVQHFGDDRMSVSDKGHRLTITFNFGPEVIIKRHVVPQNSTDRVDYLNIYVSKEGGFSRKSSGLIGRFVNSHVKLELRKSFNTTSGKTVGKFRLIDRSQPSNQSKGSKLENAVRHVIRGNLIERNEVVNKGRELCWMVHHKFDNFLYGYVADLLLPDILQA